jgi:hypothetical protein
MKAKIKNKKKPARKKQQQKKIIVASFAVGAAGILGYFGWQYLKKKKEATNVANIDQVLKPSNALPQYDAAAIVPSTKLKTTRKPSVNLATSSEGSGFPLKRGSKGEKVQMLQEALIAKYGNNALPKYGADGDFGSETINALKKAGLPTTITESTFNVLTQGLRGDISNLGKDLYTAASARNFSKVLSLLKTMSNTDDYAVANEVFKTYRLNGTRQTIVNGLLSAFTKTDQKEKIKFEFLRIGLQFDGNKWSLSGLDGKPIVTTEAATIWVTATQNVQVPARMVLGNEVSRRLDYTLFENKGKYFLVPTKSVQYL